ncbi:hypothetical protein [Microbacterium karelineae]|uniref:hypothetical protein n=1 Tax=Microbacterium karelineae TaxID=2654283 RepID=UPI0012EAE323|nr:hypothetical protein [Microbacterium karelineae]
MTSHRLVGAPIIGLWIGGAILVGASPVVLGVIVGWLVPWGGPPRAGTTGWSVLHLLWIMPAFILASALGSAVMKTVPPRLRFVRVTVDFAISVALISVLLIVFFEEWAGACTAGAIAGAGYVALKPLFDRWDRREQEARTHRV